MITLPLPPDELRTNRTQGHGFWEYQRKKKHYQTKCYVAIVSRDWPSREYPLHVTLTLYLGKGQRCDTWDVPAWAKSGLDMLKGRVFPDDDSSYLNPVTILVLRDPANPRLEISWKEKLER